MTMLKEGTDFELVPILDVNKDNQLEEDAWGVRLNTSPYTETVIKFETLKLNEEDETLTFDFSIINTPDESITVKDEQLQQHVGLVLQAILEDSLSMLEAAQEDK